MPQGPVGFSELQRLARDGRIGPGTLYWRSGLEQWTSGSDLAELNVLWRHDAEARPRGWRSDPPAARPRCRAGPDGRGPALDPLAIVSLALNLFCGVGSLAAIVVGVVALRRIARSNGTLAGKGIALAGLGLGIAGTMATLTLAYFWLFAKGAG